MSPDEPFAEWYARQRGREPFPWMERLATRFASDDIPRTLSLPTGAGKTEVALVWAWARRARPALPRRLWLVSDRRLIVDQTHDSAGILAGEGVRVSRLRGGLTREDDPLLDPICPQVIAATVDQFGSRLLFRGYGVSPRDWPIHAALAGTDSLVVLDEAHLSRNAEDILQACRSLGAEIRTMSMSATLAPGKESFIEAADLAHPVLGPRLAARRLVEPRKDGTLHEAGLELLARGCRRVALVANTVRTARATLEAFLAQTADAPEAPDLHLLIGRQRPLDRDRILDPLLPRLRPGAETSGPPIVVIATQTIEVGADLDFDGMASEGCPIDSLRQRLGRLDRQGRQEESPCLLLAPARIEPPYGEAPAAAFSWIRRRARLRRKGSPRVLDLGPKGWERLSQEVTAEMYAARAAPISLLEPHMRMLTRTSPRPAVEPEIDLLLHGAGRASGSATVVWRRDVDAEDPEASGEILRLLPPSATEACPVPVEELRRWLLGQEAGRDAGDVEGGPLGGRGPASESPPRASRVLRWRGPEEEVEAVPPLDLRAGDVVVLPGLLGGYDRHGWAPGSDAAVTDLAEAAVEARTGRKILRLDDPDIAAPRIEDAVRRAHPEAATYHLHVHRWQHGTVVELVPPGSTLADPGREVSLEDHSRRVARWASAGADALGLDATVLHLAGRYHDAGKADPRWQIAIRAGDITRLDEAPLAKGRYRKTALDGLPRGWRHELESLARLEGSGALEGLSAVQADLVRWLVGTHHGRGRPLPVDTAIPVDRLAEIQNRLQARLGPWHLALHESVLRLADRHVSRQEAEGRAEDPPARPAGPVRISRTRTHPRAMACASDTAEAMPALDPLNLRDMLAAIGLTRLVSDCSEGATVWHEAQGRYRLRLSTVPLDLPARCAAWVTTQREAFRLGGYLDVTFGPEDWRAHAREAEGLEASLWCAIGSDGVVQRFRKDRIAAPVLEYARGAGGGYSNWLGSLSAFLGHGAARYAREQGDRGVALSEADFHRVLGGQQLPTLRESEWETRELRSERRRPQALTVCRWDADVWCEYALHHAAPTKDPVLQDQTVNALAAIGLVSCPSAPTSRGLTTPMLISASPRAQELAWPLWTEPLRSAGLEAVLASGPQSWRHWPIATARRSRSGRGMLVFARAQLRSGAGGD